MGKVDVGILGVIRGKVGPVVGRKWRDLNVIGKYTKDVRNPKSEAQQLVRTRFGRLANIASRFDGVLNLGFVSVVAGTSVPARSKFISENWDHVHATVPGTATVDWADLVIAEGGLAEPSLSAPAFSAPLIVKVSQQDTSNALGAEEDDYVYVVVYSPEANACVISEPHSRTEDTIEVPVPEIWNGHQVHVWGFSYRPAGVPLHSSITGAGVQSYAVSSQSRHLGSGTIS